MTCQSLWLIGRFPAPLAEHIRVGPFLGADAIFPPRGFEGLLTELGSQPAPTIWAGPSEACRASSMQRGLKPEKADSQRVYNEFLAH